MSDLRVDNEQENSPFRFPVNPDLKDIGVNHTGFKHELNEIAIDDIFVKVIALKLFIKEWLYIVKKQLEELVNYNQPDKISSLREEMSTSEKKIERKR